MDEGKRAVSSCTELIINTYKSVCVDEGNDTLSNVMTEEMKENSNQSFRHRQ